MNYAVERLILIEIASECHAKHIRNFVMLQAESVRHAAWECDWIGTPIQFQRYLIFIIATASKEFRLTAGKFVPVSNKTLINVSFRGNSVVIRVSFQVTIFDLVRNHQSGCPCVQLSIILEKTGRAVIYIHEYDTRL
jgi:hypothetical protein